MAFSTEWFILLFVISLILVWGYHWGVKTNRALMSEVAAVLEEALTPECKEYTLLGGVIGFRARYETEKAGTVRALFTTLPRQSLLYLPVSLMMGQTDRLEVLFTPSGRPRGLVLMSTTLPGRQKARLLQGRWSEPKKITINGRAFLYSSHTDTPGSEIISLLSGLRSVRDIECLTVSPEEVFIRLRTSRKRLNDLKTLLQGMIVHLRSASF